MRKIAIMVLMTGFAIMLSGCYSAPVVPPRGLLYADVRAPMTTETRGAIGKRQGMAMATTWMGVYCKGDASITAAARDGSIMEIDHVEYHYTNFLGLVQTFTTIAYGR